MGAGFLQAIVTAATSALPIAGARVTVSQNGVKLYNLITDESGITERVTLEAPDISASLDPNYPGEPYGRCDVTVSAEGFVTKEIHGAEIFDTKTSILPVNMTTDVAYDFIEFGGAEEASETDRSEEAYLPEHGLLLKEDNHQEFRSFEGISPAALSAVVIPLTVTVHLGSPSFKEYI